MQVLILSTVSLAPGIMDRNELSMCGFVLQDSYTMLGSFCKSSYSRCIEIIFF